MGLLVWAQTSLASYEIALDVKNNASIMKCGRSKIDRFPETDSEVANSGVVKNRVVRHSGDTFDTAAIRYAFGGLPCNPGPTGRLWRCASHPWLCWCTCRKSWGKTKFKEC